MLLPVLPFHLFAKLGVVLVALILPACAASDSTVEGSGTASSQSREVSGATAVQLDTVGTVIVAHGDQASMTIEGDDNIVALIVTDVRNDTLVIAVPDDIGSLRPSVPLIHRVTLPTISAVRLNGSGRVELDTVGDDLEITLAGSGEIVAQGSTSRLSIGLSGSGSVDASELRTETAMVDVSGAGSVEVDVVDILEIEISGSGSVRHSGPATVDSTITGSGSVDPTD